MDSFTRHIGAVTVALLAVIFALGVVWQVIHGHAVDALLSGLTGTALGSLLPSPIQTGRVTVENDAGDPVPVETPKPKRRDSGLHGA